MASRGPQYTQKERLAILKEGEKTSVKAVCAKYVGGRIRKITFSAGPNGNFHGPQCWIFEVLVEIMEIQEEEASQLPVSSNSGTWELVRATRIGYPALLLGVWCKSAAQHKFNWQGIGSVSGGTEFPIRLDPLRRKTCEYWWTRSVGMDD